MRPRWSMRGDGQKDGRMDIRTGVWKFSLCSTGHQPFGAAAQKGDRRDKMIAKYSSDKRAEPETKENIYKKNTLTTKGQNCRTLPYDLRRPKKREQM